MPPAQSPPVQSAPAKNPAIPAAPRGEPEQPRESRPEPLVEPAPPRPAPQARFYFDFNSDALRVKDLPQLQAIAQIVKQRPEVSILLEGYSDPQGSRELNLALAQRRCETVQRALVEQGVPERRIRMVSFGEERGSGTAAERRRVDLRTSPPLP